MTNVKDENINEDRRYSVYVHINKINGKKYVGQTSKKPEARWRRNGIGYKEQPFYNAIEKYGWDNFNHIILADQLTQKEANETEQYWIKKWDTQHDGYNVCAGGDNNTTTHGMTYTRIYRLWCKMKERCYTPSCEAYQQNGALGIKVCDEWLHDFENFYQWAINNGYKEDLVLFRKDKTKDYSPNNCYWTTEKDKAERRESTVFYEYNGQSKTLIEWAKELGCSDSCLRHRLYNGLTIQEALEKPIQSSIQLTYKGQTHSLHKWSKILNISLGTIRQRYQRWGNNPIKIFETPILHSKKEA